MLVHEVNGIFNMPAPKPPKEEEAPKEDCSKDCCDEKVPDAECKAEGDVEMKDEAAQEQPAAEEAKWGKPRIDFRSN